MNLGDPSPYVYTKIVGITKPVAVPTMLITASNANAKDLWFLYKRYVLWDKPSGGNFSRCVQDEGLSNCTKKLANNKILKWVIDKASDSGSYGSKDTTSDDTFFDAFDIKYPIGGKVNEYITD